MRTTLNIDAAVVKRLREEAARRETTMSALVEAGARRLLDDAPPSDERPLRPLPTWKGGPYLVDIASRDEMRRAFDEGDERPLRPLPTGDCGGSLVNVADRDELHRAMEEEG